MNAIGLFITTMPESRPADYYFGCLEGSIFIDVDEVDNGLISLVRVSFDGYGCYEFPDEIRPMSREDSMLFKEIMESPEPNLQLLTALLTKTLRENNHLDWNEPLKTYQLI